MSTFRISVSEQASPIALAQPSTTVGAMVVRATKGNTEPVLIPKGNNEIIHRLFGYPSATNPDIQEALDYNNDSAIWISAPSNDTLTKKGGVLVKKSGSVALTEGITDFDNLNFSAIPYKDNIGTGDALTTNFTFTLTGTYNNTSLSEIRVGSTTIAISVTDAEPEVITGAGITSGTLTRATKALDITFDTAPALNEEIYAVYTSDESSDTYFALISKSAHTSDEQTKVTWNTSLEQFEFDFYIKDFRGVARFVDDYEGSVVPTKFNAQNQNIYLENVIDNNYFDVKVNLQTFDTFTDDTSVVSWASGERSNTFTATELTAGWTYFQQKEQYPADIFIDVTGDSAIPAIFNTLRNTYQTYKRYLIVLPDSEDAGTSVTTKTGYSIDNRGLYFYVGWGLRQENFTRTKMWTSMMGATAVKHAEIMRQAFGGLAPSWINENGLGGQLPLNIEKMRYNYTEDEQRTFDTSGINPRIKSASFGTIITSQKSGQNPALLNDFSYISGSGVTDYIITNIVNQALIPQQTKLNDDNHRTQVKTKADAVCDAPQGVNVISDYFNKCDIENNNAQVRQRREFILDTAIKITPTSEFIKFNIIAVDQGVSVEEAV